MFGNDEINSIKEVLREHINANFIAGANLMIIKDGKEVFYHENGLANREKKIPVKRDSIFRLYSMTKPITAAAAMILLERGQIDLYDPVSKYISTFKEQMVDSKEGRVKARREVMLKDLLSMTSGLVYGGGNNRAGKDTEVLFEEIDKRLFSDNPMSTLEIASRLGQCTLSFQPGENFEYGTSADVLGAVVEVVTGKRFGEFLRKEIFEPLGMKDTGFFVPEEKRGRLVRTYAEDGKGDLELYTGNHLGIIHSMDKEPAFQSGGAGLSSTIDDYAKFANMLMNNGELNGIRILKPHTVKYLTSGSLSKEQQKGLDSWESLCGYSYGNLMRVMKDCSRAGDLATLGEYGWDGWLGPYFCNCPKERLIFLFMIQKKDAGTTTLTRKLRNIILSSMCK